MQNHGLDISRRLFHAMLNFNFRPDVRSSAVFGMESQKQQTQHTSVAFGNSENPLHNVPRKQTAKVSCCEDPSCSNESKYWPTISNTLVEFPVLVDRRRSWWRATEVRIWSRIKHCLLTSQNLGEPGAYQQQLLTSFTRLLHLISPTLR